MNQKMAASGLKNQTESNQSVIPLWDDTIPHLFSLNFLRRKKKKATSKKLKSIGTLTSNNRLVKLNIKMESPKKEIGLTELVNKTSFIIPSSSSTLYQDGKPSLDQKGQNITTIGFVVNKNYAEPKNKFLYSEKVTKPTFPTLNFENQMGETNATLVMNDVRSFTKSSLNSELDDTSKTSFKGRPVFVNRKNRNKKRNESKNLLENKLVICSKSTSCTSLINISKKSVKINTPVWFQLRNARPVHRNIGKTSNYLTSNINLIKCYQRRLVPPNIKAEEVGN